LTLDLELSSEYLQAIFANPEQDFDHCQLYLNSDAGLRSLFRCRKKIIEQIAITCEATSLRIPQTLTWIKLKQNPTKKVGYV
jgi:hypothetical protein